MTTEINKPQRKRRYFERPDRDQKPLSLSETLIIVLSSHLGVRTRGKLQDDFRRANGLHIFIAGIIYFALIVAALIALVIYISR
ncbi:MAG: hypothetical protein JWM78_2259 [Verrucomicrobiaceae bacterium]|nr:hypothetical protein [Verrucomicrobiaceae bacterium]